MEAQWKRIVLKIGSALIAPDKNGCRTRYLLSIAEFMIHCRAMGTQVVLVSSGAVAAGAHAFSTADRKDIAVKKAMAAKGQMDMMAAWERLVDFPVAQLLLTQGDLQIRARYDSIRETAFALLNNDILPIVNENDAVCNDEQKVGDNDNLAAMIAAAVDADALVIFSDVNGLYNKNPQVHEDAELLSDVRKIDADILSMATGPSTKVGTGGMRTKLEAAEKATANGILTYIVNGTDKRSFELLLKGENPGTMFHPAEMPMTDDVHWITHTSRAKGEVIVSDEVEKRMIEDSLPLEYKDIVNVVGDFSVGDTILVRTEQGKKIAKATSQRSSCVLSLVTNDEVGDQINVEEHIGSPILSSDTLAILNKRS